MEYLCDTNELRLDCLISDCMFYLLSKRIGLHTVMATNILDDVRIHTGAQDWATARFLLEQAIAVPCVRHQARFMLWEVCQVLGEPEIALSHLRAALKEYPMTHRICEAPHRRVLALMVPGDFQANLPIEILLDGDSTELHSLWIMDPEAALKNPRSQFPEELPEVDCVFVAIAEDVRHQKHLMAADAIAEYLQLPVINAGSKIAQLSRTGAADLLQGIPHTIVPRPRLLTTSGLTTALNGSDIEMPIIIRPEGSHAGAFLEKASSIGEVIDYVGRHREVESVYVAPFVNFANADGQWRKYRIVFVEGEPYPFHLAIHHDWAIWYYNSRMDLSEAKRREEEAFLRDIRSVFSQDALNSLRKLGELVGLDYFGVDCGYTDRGEVVLFEVETGMIVHDRDPADIYPYKKTYVPRIMRAVERMIDRKISEFRNPTF